MSTSKTKFTTISTITVQLNSSVSEYGDRKSLADLHSELKILIHVGENENIVNILGACTKG